MSSLGQGQFLLNGYLGALNRRKAGVDQGLESYDANAREALGGLSGAQAQGTLNAQQNQQMAGANQAQQTGNLAALDSEIGRLEGQLATAQPVMQGQAMPQQQFSPQLQQTNLMQPAPSVGLTGQQSLLQGYQPARQMSLLGGGY